MRKVSFYSSLIQAIEQIYMMISLTLLHKRIDGHQQKAEFQPHAKDIKTPLHHLIRSAPAQQVLEAKGAHNLLSSARTEHVPAQYNTQDSHEIGREDVEALSGYFRRKLHDPVAHSSFEIQMEHRTWEHVHAVVRYVYQGDKRKAKLHADIASTACKELAHFMDESTYVDFVSRIETYLEAVKIEEAI